MEKYPCTNSHLYPLQSRASMPREGLDVKTLPQAAQIAILKD